MFFPKFSRFIKQFQSTTTFKKYQSSYFKDIVRNGNESREVLARQIISGFTCMEHDRLFEVSDDLEILPNDQIVYHKVGAYTMCLSPLFIKWFPAIYVKEGENIIKARDRWTVVEYKSRYIGDKEK